MEVIARTKNDAAIWTALENGARFLDLSVQIGAAVEHIDFRQHLLHFSAGAIDIEDRQHNSFRPGDALDKRHNAVQRITFDADEDNVRRILIFLSGAGFHRNGLARSIPDTIDEQTALCLDGCKMCAASDQRHILAALCELATDRTGRTVNFVRRSIRA